MSVLTPPRLLSSDVLGSHEISVLAVTWQHPITRQISVIGLLSKNIAGIYRFSYVRNVLAIEDFQPLVGFPDLDRNYEADSLFPLFAQRVMEPRRPDYSRFISSLGLSDSPTPWEQISHSGGRRAGDTLQLLPVPVPCEGQLNSWEVSFLVHGMRHIAGEARILNQQEVSISRDQQERALASLRSGSDLSLVREPSNPKNNNAVVVTDKDCTPLGYVPDLFTLDLAALDLNSISCTAEVVNGPDAPWHMRLVAKLRCTVPPAFEFFTDEAWQPLANS
ncbi:HIRAN domain-containing protein [Glutamicibacter sp. HZAU]|uniref:HIRAN domain-containing protein n=1 Tax=Glutamicibacter sp. HZAU TaxID=2049891 RepID=UPI000FFB4985|nr:HIRAN domain-containing protein [Glutamicibacter sp. HZAU]RWZ83237.1 hypothetical protein EKH49_08600 [Glutamicibacter sp. HZAU]